MYDRPPTGTVAAAEDAAPSTRATGSDVVLSPWQLLLPENSSNVTFPVALPLLLSYILSFGVIFGGSPPTFFEVLAYIPPTAPIASTTLYAIGDASIGEVLISAALCVLATAVTARVAARVYERSILRTGARVRLREALRGEGSA